MSKAVLLSIRPNWCKKIANLRKTVEIRKTAPNLEVPFKCYIYCTKAPKKLITIFRDGEESYDGEIYHGKTKFITWDGIGVPDDIDSAMQMVIGEFVCDDIRRIGPEYCVVKEDMVSDYIISRRMDVTITMLDDLLGGQAKDDNNFCGGTGAMLSFAPDGSAYPCIRYAPISIGEEKSQKVRFGSIYDGLYATDAQRQAKAELDAITRTSQSPQECLECPVSAGCGWCSGLNYELFGTANKRSTAICWAHKARVLASCYYHNRRYLEIGDCLPIEVRLPAEDGLKILPAEKWAELMHIETAALMKFADEVGIS